MTSTKDDDEWTIVPPGAAPPTAAGGGPSAAEWSIMPPKGELPPIPMTGRDAVNIGAQGGNAFLFGMGNRIIAASRALEGKEGYSDTLARLAAEDKAVRARHPWSAAGAEVVGGLGNAAALASRGVLRGAGPGADWLAQGVRGAGEGGVLGALQGAGTTYSGIPSDYVHNAGMGGVLGAGIGAVAPAAGNLVTTPVRAMADRGWFGGPIKELAVAAQADAAGLRNLPNIPGSMLPDAGPSMLGTAQGSVIGTGGPGKTALTENLRARDAGTGQRITGHLDQDFGPAPIPSHVDAQIAERMRLMGDAYDRVLANARAVDPNPTALWLEGQIGRTAGPGQAAFREVRRELDIPTNPGVLDPHPIRMQAVRSSIGRQIRDPNIDPDRRNALELVHQRLTRELQDKVPGIREVDHAYAELGSQQRAIGVDQASAGKDIFDTGKNAVWRPVELQEAVTGASQPKGVNVGPSAEGFRLREAARAEIDRIVGTAPNDLRKLETLLGEPQDWNSQKLAIMFGRERGEALRAVLDRERNQRHSYQEIVQGPQTAQRLAAAKALDAGEGKIPWETTIWGTVLRGGQEGIKKLVEGRAANKRDAIAHLMATQDPARVQQLVDQMLAAQPTRDMRQELVKRLIERGAMGAPALAPSVTNR